MKRSPDRLWQIGGRFDRGAESSSCDPSGTLRFHSGFLEPVGGYDPPTYGLRKLVVRQFAGLGNRIKPERT
jgi:hypothetical protein